MTWKAWKLIVNRMPAGRHRENLLSIYGPISLILLISIWAFTLILGFGLLHLGTASLSEDQTSLATNLYYSGATFFTLGLGDVRPLSPLARLLTIVEAGTGLGFLALIIGYLPGLNQSFSRREVNISLLDARAGSPPTAAEMLSRHHGDHGMESIRELLREWERWSAELLESHLSYPVLAYYRSQHDNQSWLAGLATILDTSAFVMVGLEGACVPPGAAYLRHCKARRGGSFPHFRSNAPIAGAGSPPSRSTVEFEVHVGGGWSASACRRGGGPNVDGTARHV